MQQRERWFYILISPWAIGFLCFQVGPILGAFWLSFHEWRLPQTPRFIGLGNFRNMLADGVFWQSLGNTLYYALVAIPAGIALGLALALILNRSGLNQNILTVFRAIFFMPVVISGVATTLVWGWVFNSRYGLINAILAAIGLHGPAWLQDAHWAMPALILMSLWTIGVNMLVYSSALRGIPRELKDAAALDGADAWVSFWHITWPLISSVTFYLLVVNWIGAFQLFLPAYVLTRGGPENSTMTLSLYIYQNTFGWGRPGYSAALALVLFAIVMTLTAIQFRLSRRWVFYSGNSR